MTPPRSISGDVIPGAILMSVMAWFLFSPPVMMLTLRLNVAIQRALRVEWLLDLRVFGSDASRCPWLWDPIVASYVMRTLSISALVFLGANSHLPTSFAVPTAMAIFVLGTSIAVVVWRVRGEQVKGWPRSRR